MHKVQIKDYLPYLSWRANIEYGSGQRDNHTCILKKSCILKEILAVRYQEAFGSTEVYTDDLDFFVWFNDNK